MGSLLSSLTGAGGDGGLGAAQQALLGQQEQDQIQMMNVEGQEDKISTAAQEATSMANTMNSIAKEFEDVSSAKQQAQSEVAKSSSDATRQA